MVFKNSPSSLEIVEKMRGFSRAGGLTSTLLPQHRPGKSQDESGDYPGVKTERLRPRPDSCRRIYDEEGNREDPCRQALGSPSDQERWAELRRREHDPLYSESQFETVVGRT